MKRIYLDYASTTPCDPKVAELMTKYLTFEGEFGNPASRSHSFGWEADQAIDTARHQVADLIGADPREIVFTRFFQMAEHRLNPTSVDMT